MRIFLTGVSGYFGGLLAETLARVSEVEGITGIDVTEPATDLPTKVDFVQMDIRSPKVEAAMAGHEVVVHTAFIVLWFAKMPATVRDDINLIGVQNMARAAAANEVQRFVHASSTAVYDVDLLRGQSDTDENAALGKGDSFSYYCNGKAMAERTLSEVLGSTGTVLTFLRPTYVLGPRNRATVDSMRETAVNIRGRDPRIQYVHEDDVAAAFQQAVLADMPGAYNVVPDDFIRLSEAWQILGLDSVRTVPAWAARLAAVVQWRFFGSQTHPSWVSLMMSDATVSNAKLRATGWVPSCGSADALRSAL
ncbi:MAG: NAD-dependent epimerase/dehydratase family protein [Anaerolineae bacterium]